MVKTFKTQVPKSHYLEEYDTLPRFVSYYYQIDSILAKKPKSILIIGTGTNLLGEYLKNYGIKVTTADFDKSLHPDVVADIRNIPLKNKSYDMVVAFEVLEHIPFSDVETALSEMKRISKKHVIISVPYSCFFIEPMLNFHIPKVSKFFHFSLRVPYTFIKTHLGGEHFWELGRRDFPKRKLRSILKKHFYIEKEFSPPINSYHRFFILKK